MAFVFTLLIPLTALAASSVSAADLDGTIWFASANGLYRSDDDGATWQLNPVSAPGATPGPTIGNIPATAVRGYAVAVDPADSNKIYYISSMNHAYNDTPEGIFRSADHGKTWTYKSFVDSVPAACSSDTEHCFLGGAPQCYLCIDYANPQYWYLGGGLRSSDGGNTWQMSINYVGAILDPTVSGLVYAPVSGQALLVSHDYGATYATLNTAFGGHAPVNAFDLRVDPATGDVYATETDRLVKSSDGGNTWSDPLAGFHSGQANLTTAFDWVTGDVYHGNSKSTDHGGTWQVYTEPNTGGLPRGAGPDAYLSGQGLSPDHTSVFTDPNFSGHALGIVRDEGLANGLIRTTDSGRTWAHIALPSYCKPSPNPGGHSTLPPCAGINTYPVGIAFAWPHINQRQPAPQPAAQPAPADSTASPTVRPTTVPLSVATPVAGDDTLTDDIRQNILDAITRANNGWTAAKSSLDVSTLAGNVADQELADDTAAVNRLQAAAQYEVAVQDSISITDVTLDAPDHATVHTTEVWEADIFNLINNQHCSVTAPGCLAQRLGTTTYNETYTVEFQNGGWIVTLDQL